MDVGVTDVLHIVSVMSKSCKASTIEIDNQGVVRYTEHINPDVEFFSANEQRISDISLNDVRFTLLN